MTTKNTWQTLSPTLLYPALIPHIIKLCIKHKCSPAIITASNPIFEYGGLPFASKLNMQSHFDNVLPARLLNKRESFKTRLNHAKQFAEVHGFPLIIKPDTGHRGIGVEKITSPIKLQQAVSTMKWNMILQKHASFDAEFGIFYYCPPEETVGQIISITEKIIPKVVGDGISTINQLIKKGQFEQPEILLKQNKIRAHRVLQKGEEKPLLAVASHNRGAMFFDRSNQKTDVLEKRIQALSKNKEFYFGRFDVRAKDLSTLLTGEFEIIEINGATSEFIHIYDEKYTYKDGINELKRQWELLFEVSAANKHKATPYGLLPMVLDYIKFFQATKSATGKYW